MVLLFGVWCVAFGFCCSAWFCLGWWVDLAVGLIFAGCLPVLVSCCLSSGLGSLDLHVGFSCGFV